MINPMRKPNEAQPGIPDRAGELQAKVKPIAAQGGDRC